MIKIKKVRSQYIGVLRKYLVVVERFDTPQKYADFVCDPEDDGEIQEVAKNGFKPELLQEFLNESLS